MSIADHFDALSVYEAQAVRLTPVDGEPEDLLGDGGGLEAAFERVGQAVLVGVLRDASVQSVMLADGDLQIIVERTATGGQLTLRWGDQVVIDEKVAIPPVLRSGAGPWFRPDPDAVLTDLNAAIHDITAPVYAVRDVGGQQRFYGRGLHGRGVGQEPLVGVVRPLGPDDLGAAAFRAAHGVKWSYVCGAMAGGIGSAELVIAMARAGLIGFFGAGGLPLAAVEEALKRVKNELEGGAWGFNLLHNPAEPRVEEETVDLYLKYGVPRVSASANMGLSPAVVRYRLSGVHEGRGGAVVCPNKVFAKVSRPEVAEKFMRPAPDAILEQLVADGALTQQQAELGRRIPVAMDITAEADSGGHTDHRPLVVLLPAIQALRDRIVSECGYGPELRPRVGVGGGLGTPSALWAAFAMGADYVLTGSVNQATLEAGTSELAKNMLTQASFYDVASGPAPDMFEIGAKVQVLSRGSMYAQRAQRLHDIYKSYDSIEAIPAKERSRIEKRILLKSLDEVWEGTEAYWAERDPKQVERAKQDGRHKMALCFRWYLGMTSRWARTGDQGRKRDFQVWCGPAMGAFNQWAEGTTLEPLSARTGPAIAEALMRGAAAHARVASARSQGLVLPPGADAVGLV